MGRVRGIRRIDNRLLLLDGFLYDMDSVNIVYEWRSRSTCSISVAIPMGQIYRESSKVV